MICQTSHSFSEESISSANIVRFRDFFKFFAQIFAERTPKGVRQSIQKDSTLTILSIDYIGHVFTNLSGISCVVICDKEYPQRVAFGLINKILDDVSSHFTIEKLQSSNEIDMPFLSVYLKKFQNPSEADSIMKVQKELDETKDILNRTLESLLQRGEKLDDLVARSDQLGAQSKAFYKASKKTNSCCVIQ